MSDLLTTPSAPDRSRPFRTAAPSRATTSRPDERGVLAAVRRVNRTVRPEESVPLRISVLVAVMIAVIASWTAGSAAAGDAIIALLLLPVGARVAHLRRAHDNYAIKAALSVGVVLVLARFFGDVRVATSIDDTRAPLAALFLAVQVLHGFDLPQRRDLLFTLTSSLALVALGATTTDGMWFALPLAAWAGAAGVALQHAQVSLATERADVAAENVGGVRLGSPVEASDGSPRRTGRAEVRNGLRVAAPMVALGVIVFLLLPRSETTRLGNLPFRGLPGLNLASPFITNSEFSGNGSSDDDPADFSPGAWVGFSEYADLRTVGELEPTPVLRVRADRPRFWRGMVFDTYDGAGWRRSTDEPPAPTFGTPVRVSTDRGLHTPTSTARVTQTFELLADTPNLVFGAAQAREVWHAAGNVTLWRDGTISTSALQDEGTVYSIVSEVITTTPEVLRAADGPLPPDVAATYLQLPSSVPARVQELAAQLTADTKTPYAKAEAIEDWIGANTRYSLGAPAPPRGADAVDHFLFESKTGWCEPIASSMVVMLRSSGVAARFATGFQPGARNPLTGVYDVRLDMAHAWVEVFIPGEGWIAFDPTGAVPQAVDGSTVSRLPLLEVFAVVADATRRGVDALPGWLHLGLVLLALGGAATSVLARRPEAEDAHAFGALTRHLADAGLEREPWQTPREFIATVQLRRPDLPAAALTSLLEAEERRAWGHDGT